MTETQIENIAQVCHEANRAFCQTIGDESQKSWGEAEDWQRESAIEGVKFALSGDHVPGAQHEAWRTSKLQAGWKYGPIKDAVKKEHPCMVPFDELPSDQQIKDYLFIGVVEALTEFNS